VNVGKQKHSLLVYKIRREGMPPYVLDFSELGLAFEVARGFRRALEAEMGHTSVDTQSKAFSALRKLSQCLQDLGLRGQSPLPKDTLSRFANWLDASTLGPSAQVNLTKVRQLTAWCERNTPGVIAKNADLVVRKIRRLRFEPARDGLPEIAVKDVLRACYDDIERIELERGQIRKILSGMVGSPKEREFLLLTRDLVRAGKGQFARQHVYHRSGGSIVRRIGDFGGSRTIAHLTYLSPRDILPFLVAILAQSSGNPESIKRAEAECIFSHPVRDDIERIIWLKKRSSGEQFADFPKAKKWSAPDLVRRLNALTVGLRHRAVLSSQGKLFICYRWYSRSIGMPGRAAMLEELRAFIVRNSLPPFQFKDLRRTGGQFVQAVHGKVQDAQRHLNHESTTTTQRYTRTQLVADQDDQIIHAHQVQFVRLAKYGNHRGSASTVGSPDFDIPAEGMETIFGFRCKDPLAGVAPGSIRGSMCLQFFSCASCPGAFIPLDDVDVVAKLLSAADVLNEAKGRSLVEGWQKRYEAVYESSRRLIEETFLPAISQAILERAKLKVERRLIPRLE
jgi:hypothetical protein